MNLPALFCCIVLLAGISSRADAATYLEASRLDDAYSQGSTEVCIQDLPGDGNNILPTRFEVRGKL